MTDKKIALLALGFRPFYLLASLWAIFTVFEWLLELQNMGIRSSNEISGMIWHAHEMIYGFALILGYRTRLVAIGLAVFTLLASIAGHAFWAAPADAVFIAQLLFFKNIAVIGGLLVLASSGTGSISVDGFREAK